VLPLTLVLALADDGALGRAGALPWSIPEDRRHFEALVRGHALIMGRRTFDETGAPIFGGSSIVLSRHAGRAMANVVWVTTFDEAVARAREIDPDPRVIGGAQVFELACPLATRIELTEVHRKVDADTYFQLDRSAFRETSRRPCGTDPTVEFVTLER
jgi:dihydrofolate reductase